MTTLALISPDAFLDDRDMAAHFNTLSLSSWLRLAGMAGVPAVGGTVIGKITESDMVVMMDILEGGDIELPPNVFNLAKAIEGFAGQDIMVRSDGGSGSSVKGFMGRKLEPGVERGFGDASHWFNGRGFITNDRPDTLLKAMIDFDDDRLDTIFMDWPEAELPMLARPLVKARVIESDNGQFQAEWRVFINGGRISGVSTYYPQAPRLEDQSKEDIAALGRVLESSLRLLGQMEASGIVPVHRHYAATPGVDLSQPHCTLDFIESADGDVLLLEGGPANIPDMKWGAHPCAFEIRSSPDQVLAERSISGIAWGGDRFSPEADLNLMVEAAAERISDCEQRLSPISPDAFSP